jgi:tetrahydromethanopterin S-methyltransferase subunit G
MELDDDKFIKLIETITENTVKLDGVTSNINSLDQRMMKLETLREQDIKQNEKIEQILISLKTGTQHFEKIDKRLDALENKDGETAKKVWKTIGGIFLAAICGVIISNIGNIIRTMGGAN